MYKLFQVKFTFKGKFLSKFTRKNLLLKKFTQRVYKKLWNMKLGRLKIGKSPYVIQQVVLFSSETFRRQYETIVSVIPTQSDLSFIEYWFEFDRTRTRLYLVMTISVTVYSTVM